MNNLTKAVCLLSGGMDSAVALGKALTEYRIVYPLFVKYGQRSEANEEKAVKGLVEYYRNAMPAGRIDDVRIIAVPIKELVGSAITADDDTQIPEKDVEGEIPPTYCPARNTILIALALGYAETVDADAIYIGANSIDYSGYPDCRPEYMERYQDLINIATKKTVETEDGAIKLEVPLQYLTKVDIIELGILLNVPLEHTWSCYKGGDNACGSCSSCQLRLQGFKDAGEADPIGYEALSYTIPDGTTIVLSANIDITGGGDTSMSCSNCGMSSNEAVDEVPFVCFRCRDKTTPKEKSPCDHGEAKMYKDKICQCGAKMDYSKEGEE